MHIHEQRDALLTKTRKAIQEMRTNNQKDEN